MVPASFTHIRSYQSTDTYCDRSLLKLAMHRGMLLHQHGPPCDTIGVPL